MVQNITLVYQWRNGNRYQATCLTKLKYISFFCKKCNAGDSNFLKCGVSIKTQCIDEFPCLLLYHLLISIVISSSKWSGPNCYLQLKLSHSTFLLPHTGKVWVVSKSFWTQCSRLFKSLHRFNRHSCIKNGTALQFCIISELSTKQHWEKQRV